MSPVRWGNLCLLFYFIALALWLHERRGWALVIAIWMFLYRSRAGLVLRAVGDNHASAHALGYPVLRMSDIPPMDVQVISTDNPPTGVGEAGVPVVAPAIANAVAQITGVIGIRAPPDIAVLKYSA